VLQALTLGRLPASRIHNACETLMLSQHCRVHQSLIEGVERAWRDWLRVSLR